MALAAGCGERKRRAPTVEWRSRRPQGAFSSFKPMSRSGGGQRLTVAMVNGPNRPSRARADLGREQQAIPDSTDLF